MTTVRAAVLDTIGLPAPYAESRPLKIRQVELAPPGPGEVRVAVRAAGLCHSDLSVISGEMEVEVAGVIQTAKAGETLRYRCDRPHIVRNVSKKPAHATMVCILKAAVME